MREIKREETTEKTKYTTYIEELNYGYEITVYANNGGTLLLKKIYNTIKDCEVAEIIVKSEFENGYIRCADCGKLVMYDSIKNNRYFAGLYCNECWEREWKKVEAQEDYN